MTREEAINICKREQYCASHSVCSLEECPWNENCPDDAPFDSEIQEAFQMAIEALSAPQWIPCSERLPETEDMMLVSCETKKGIKTVNRAYYCNGFWHGSGSMSGVIAWMPLPEPYEEEKKDERIG